MKIIKHGKKDDKTMRGTCTACGCKIECYVAETQYLSDRDTTAGCATHYVRCPECNTDFLWVK